jgi:hypothetical protein
LTVPFSLAELEPTELAALVVAFGGFGVAASPRLAIPRRANAVTAKMASRFMT